MKPTSIQNPSTSKGGVLGATIFSKQKKLSSYYELHPRFKAMVWTQPFSNYNNKNPFNHLQEFEEMCSHLSILGMTQEILKWKLFPFSLSGEVKQ
jgi:hypothetical protein